MLVTNTVFKNRYIYNGQTSFPISFPFLDASHVEVWWSVSGAADTNAQLLDRNTFTITGAGNPAGGTLIRTGDWAMGATIAIVRNIPITQLHQYTQYDDFPAESHEDALAKLTMICQEQQEVLDRAMTVPVTSGNDPQEYWLEIIEQNRIAMEAANSAVDAAYKAEECKVQSCDCATDALATETRINEAAQDQLNSITSIGQRQLSIIQIEGDNTVNVIANEGNTQVQRVQAEGTTQEQRIDSLGANQYEQINTLSLNYLGRITNTGTDYITNIGNSGELAIEQINTTISSAINQVTDTGNFQTARVNSIGNDTVQRVREEVNIVVSEADRAKEEADRAKEEADRAQHTALGELPIATQVIQGITRLATTEEHLTGADSTIAATPFGARQMIQQFTSVTIQGPIITGPDDVRESSTHTYAFYAKALLPEAKIYKFIYHFDELSSNQIEVLVPTNAQAAEVTINTDITFPGGLGTTNTIIAYAVDSFGNTSRFVIKRVEIRLNEPPVMTDFTHTIPAFLAKSTAYEIQMSGAVDPDGDPITYKFDFGTTGITARPNNGIVDNQAVILTTPGGISSANPTPLTFKVIAIDSIGATNEVSITINIISQFKTPTIGIPTAGQLDFSPTGTITWSNYSIDHDVLFPTITGIRIATDASFTDMAVSERLSGAVTSWAGTLPYNRQLYATVQYINVSTETYSPLSSIVNFTTKVTAPTPTLLMYSGSTSNNVCGGDLLTSGDTITATSINNNLIGVSYDTSNNAISPTGEMPISVTFQAAASQDFADPYTQDIAVIANFCNTSVVKEALTSGKITAGSPSKLAYFRLRFNYGAVGPTGYTTEITSAWSAIQTISILSASLTAPVPVSPATGSVNQDESSLTLSWNNGTAIGQDITRVQVQVYITSPSNIVKDSGNLAGTTTQWTVTGLSLGSLYYWRVRNYGSATGWSAWSTIYSFTTFNFLFTSDVIFLNPNYNSTMIPRKKDLTVSWTPPSYQAGSPGTLKYKLRLWQGSRILSSVHDITTSSYTIPANTMPAASTGYTIDVVAYFNVNDIDKDDAHYTSSGIVYFTTSPAPIAKIFTVSENYTIPYTGMYILRVLGAGGYGGDPGITDNPYNGVSAMGGGGAGGYAQGLIELTQGTVLVGTVGGGGGTGGGGASSWDEDTHRARIIGYGGNAGTLATTYHTGGGAGGATYLGPGFTNRVEYNGGNGGNGTFTAPVTDYICGVYGGVGGLTGDCSSGQGSAGQPGISTCQDITGFGTWLVVGGPGGGGGICTPFGYDVGGGGGYQGGNRADPASTAGQDAAKRGQNGRIYIESAWEE